MDEQRTSAKARKQTFIPASRIASAASEQRAAVQEVRARAATAARLIADQHDASADRAMVDQTIAGLGRTH